MKDNESGRRQVERYAIDDPLCLASKRAGIAQGISAKIPYC